MRQVLLLHPMYQQPDMRVADDPGGKGLGLRV